MSHIWSSLGSGRAEGLAPGGACGGGRSRFACGLLWCGIRYHPPLYCLNPVRLDRFILGSHIFLVGCRCRSDVRWASLSLPARALGAKWDHVTNTALLSGVGLCAFVVFVFVSLVNPFVGVPLALMAMVATPVIGSLFAIREDYHYTVPPVRATVIAVVITALYVANYVYGWVTPDSIMNLA